MGIALAHHPEAAHAVELAALVPGDDAGRNVERAHHDHESRRNVLAESRLAVEPELVGGIGMPYSPGSSV
jgi:hypothetical protein